MAGGSPAAVAEAVQATGRDAETLVEAVRFYLQQALFGEGADAYRVLGVDRHAGIELIRRHHKLLQAWLHPDRNADAWNDVFSTRINQAWTALRSDSARARYDANPPASGAPAPGGAQSQPAPLSRRLAPRWNVLAAPGGRSRARWLALAGFASCVVLLGLILFGEAPRPVPVARMSAPTPAPPVEPVIVADAADAKTDAEALARLVVASLPDGAAAMDITAAVPPVEAVPISAPSETVRSQSPVAAGPTASAPALSRAEPPVQRRPVAPARPPSASTREPVAVAAAPRLVPATVQPSPAPLPALRPAVPVPATLPSAASTPPPDPFLRMQEAQASLRAALAFLSAQGTAAPPLWNDVRAAEDGARTREALHARGRVRAIDVTGNHWVLRDDEARFGGRYATGGRAGEQGRLALRLVRREGLWLVADLRLEPAG